MIYILDALKWLATEVLKIFSSEALKQLFQKLFKRQETPNSNENAKNEEGKFTFTDFPNPHQGKKYVFKDFPPKK